jgi:hypothetical protein
VSLEPASDAFPPHDRHCRAEQEVRRLGSVGTRSVFDGAYLLLLDPKCFLLEVIR